MTYSYTHLGLQSKTEQGIYDLLAEIGLTRIRNTPKRGFQMGKPFQISYDTGATDKNGDPVFAVRPCWYANVRIWGAIATGKDVDSLATAKGSKSAPAYTSRGDADDPKLPAGVSYVNGRVYNLDPATIKTPARVWA